MTTVEKSITGSGTTVYVVVTSVFLEKIGEDLDESLQKEPTAAQEIDSDLCYECYRDLEQVLQNGRKEEKKKVDNVIYNMTVEIERLKVVDYLEPKAFIVCCMDGHVEFL